jgi:hypothetical protein
MADIGRQENWLVSPTREVEIKWMDVKIQEVRSRMAANKQRIEDALKGVIVDLEAKNLMLQMELDKLLNDKKKLSQTEG